jgi:hypothetical protein
MLKETGTREADYIWKQMKSLMFNNIEMKTNLIAPTKQPLLVDAELACK